MDLGGKKNTYRTSQKFILDRHSKYDTFTYFTEQISTQMSDGSHSNTFSFQTYMVRESMKASHVRKSHLWKIVTCSRGKLLLKTAFCLVYPIDVTRNRLCDARHSFRIGKGEIYTPPRIRSTRKTAQRIARTFFFPPLPLEKKDPIRISSRDPLKLSACSRLSFFSPHTILPFPRIFQERRAAGY